MFLCKKNHIQLPEEASDLKTHRRAIVISGMSGAGKTTLMRELFGSVRGAVMIAQASALPADMTPRQLAVFYSSLFGHQLSDYNRLMEDLGIGDIMDRRFGEMNDPVLSGGEKRRAHLLAILALPPERCPIIMVDEPFQGLDEESQQRVAHVLRIAADQRSIVLCLHHIPQSVSEWIDEEWSITDRSILIGKTDRPMIESIQAIRKHRLQEMWALLRRRDMIMGNFWWGLVAKAGVPIVICLFPMICYGSPGAMWDEFISSPSPNLAVVTAFQILVHIIMFVCTIMPVIFLSTHAEWKELVDHEVSCGLYQRSSFIVSRMGTEIATMGGVCIIIQSILFRLVSNLITVFSWTSWNMMCATHSMIWVCLYTLNMPFIWCLLTVIGYTAVSFISHIGFMLRWPILQNLSLLTVEMSIILDRLSKECPTPSHARVIHAIKSYLQTDCVVELSDKAWVVRSILWFPVAPILIMIIIPLIQRMMLFIVEKIKQIQMASDVSSFFTI